MLLGNPSISSLSTLTLILIPWISLPKNLISIPSLLFITFIVFLILIILLFHSTSEYTQISNRFSLLTTNWLPKGVDPKLIAALSLKLLLPLLLSSHQLLHLALLITVSNLLVDVFEKIFESLRSLIIIPTLLGKSSLDPILILLKNVKIWTQV